MLVPGARGMLGRAVVSLLRGRAVECTPLDRSTLDLADEASIERAIAPGARIVINCAAYTDVDGAETNTDAARIGNATGVGALAQRCRDVGAMLVHFSTDYVFDGAGTPDGSPYPADHPKNPINAYGRTKSEGEDLILASGAAHLILRTSWLYAPWGRNFVRTIARAGAEKPVLRVVNDQRGRPTSAEHLARTTLAMIEAGARGVHHATDAGECTWYEFASEIVRALGLPARVEPCTSAEFPRPAARPAYSVLDISTTEALIGPLTPWQDALADTLNRLEPQ
ncbi:MAG: dTDP-4-dehydrorhamnose reductase [Phycisphaerales bacterium]|nr:MAG: dTDP-4-dehydrorhamnose reductase [Phycisphaerales bacterium]